MLARMLAHLLFLEEGERGALLRHPPATASLDSEVPPSASFSAVLAGFTGSLPAPFVGFFDTLAALVVLAARDLAGASLCTYFSGADLMRTGFALGLVAPPVATDFSEGGFEGGEVVALRAPGLIWRNCCSHLSTAASVVSLPGRQSSCIHAVPSDCDLS